MVEIGAERQQDVENKGIVVTREEKLPTAAASGSAAIASRLQRAVMDGTYAYGERLPAERELADHFGASRSTIREALKRLEELRLVTRRIGSGTFVSYRPSDDGGSIAEITSPLELIEVRMALEPDIVKLAAINATARDLTRLGEALDRVERAGNDRNEFSLADEQFHLTLVECTRNPLMSWLYQHINDVRGHTQWNSMKDQILTDERITDYNLQHRKLYEALCSRDVEKAVSIMERHIEQARIDLLGAGSGI